MDMKLFDKLMDIASSDDNGRSTFKEVFRYGFVVISIALIIISSAVFLDIKKNLSLTPDFAKLGAIGDFVGGVLNPLLAFLVLLVLLATTRLQKVELEQTRSELRETANTAKQANIENAFFQLFNLLQENLQTTYYNIVRASLSNYELFLIMANCMTEAGEPMKKYVSKFQLFDNLPKDILVVSYAGADHRTKGKLDLTDLWSEFDEKSFGNNPDFCFA